MKENANGSLSPGITGLLAADSNINWQCESGSQRPRPQHYSMCTLYMTDLQPQLLPDCFCCTFFLSCHGYNVMPQNGTAGKRIVALCGLQENDINTSDATPVVKTWCTAEKKNFKPWVVWLLQMQWTCSVNTILLLLLLMIIIMIASLNN